VNELVVAEVDDKCALIQKIGGCLSSLLLHRQYRYVSLEN
jgi:hypothetical protein